MPVGNSNGVPVSSQALAWTIAIIGRGSPVRFGIPACHRRMSRISMLPRRKVGWKGGEIARRCSSSSGRDLDVVTDPDPELTVRPRPDLRRPVLG